MTFPPCPRSHGRACGDAGSVLCGVCITRVERHLRALPRLHQECLHHASPTVRRTNPTKVSASRTRDHLDISVLDARHHLRAVLESWSGVVVEKRGAAPPACTVPHLARFLLRHLGWLAAQPPAGDFADEVENLVVALRRIIDPGPGGVRTLIRRCVADGCAGTISAVSRRGAGARSAPITCSAGHSWEIREWLLLGRLMEGQRDGVGA
ncbi:hypothetical protein [Streptomyces sp. NPDC058092]|uniref:hypothetical protein n=1 Tax=Streptomyces sp. NPDC058092 TaxID=3346336 RepID=UPI0036F116BF